MVQTATNLLLVLGPPAPEPKPRAWETLENEPSVMERGTQLLSYYCSQHPGAACWRAGGLLLATRHQSFINQPPGFVPDDVFDIYTTFFFSFFITPRKKKKPRIKDLLVSRPSFKKTELLYGSVFMQ